MYSVKGKQNDTVRNFGTYSTKEEAEQMKEHVKSMYPKMNVTIRKV